MKPKINICLIGGEDAHKRIALSQILIKNGFNVTILGTQEYDYPENINFTKYSLNRKLDLVSDFKTILEYRKIIKKNNFDIVQTFDTKPAFLVPIACFGLKTKIVRTITGLGTIFMGENIKFKILRLVYKILHKIAKRGNSHTTFQNEADKNYFIANNLVSTNNSSIIYGSGIDLYNIKNIATRKNARHTFILVARLVFEKGIINYLEAAKLCIDKGYSFEFLLVGPLEEDSSKLNLSILNDYKKYVNWLGVKSNVSELMMKADTFVLPTFREGFSRVLLEASAIGLPIITTNVPGTKEIVTNGKEGILVNLNDSEDLHKAMIYMAENPKIANEMSENTLIKVKQFSLEKISTEYIKLYKKNHENTIFTTTN